jgi:trehalose/maltose transport system substrate-binding protein
MSRWCVMLVVICAGCRTAPPAPAPLKLSVLGLGLEAGEQLKQDALTEYSSKTGIEIDLIPTPGTSAEQLPVVLDLFRRQSRSPDILLIDGTWPGTLHEHLVDLAPYLNDEAHRHAKPLLENNTIDGRIVALPLYMSGGMLFYRADLLKKYGYAAPPNTWKQLENMALRIQKGERREGKRSFWGYIWQGGEYEGLTCNALEWQSSYGGGNIVENDGAISVDNTHAAEALSDAASWIGSIAPPSVLAYTEADTSNVFRSGNAAFMRHWTSAFRAIRDTMRPSAVDVALLPAGPAGRATTIGGFHLAVSRYSLHTREAAALILYLTGTEVQTRRALRRGFLPTYPELHHAPQLVRDLPQARIFSEASVASWIFRPASITGRKYPEVSKAYFQYVHRALAGEMPTDRALAEIRKKLRTLADSPTGLFQH